jgi:transcriptional regulator with XRE-family HTH domain
MKLIRLTGSMLRAARSLTGLSQQELADRASICRPCLTAWKGSYLLAHDDGVIE